MRADVAVHESHTLPQDLEGADNWIGRQALPDRVEVLNDGHGIGAASRCCAGIAGDDVQPVREAIAHLYERRPLDEVHAVAGLA